jgi:hypothetical protein
MGAACDGVVGGVVHGLAGVWLSGRRSSGSACSGWRVAGPAGRDAAAGREECIVGSAASRVRVRGRPRGAVQHSDVSGVVGSVLGLALLECARVRERASWWMVDCARPMGAWWAGPASAGGA